MQEAPTYTETWRIDPFVPDVRNRRKNDAAVDRMWASIREFGFKIPCLVRSDGEVVDGQLQLKAARRLGLTELRVTLCDEWMAAQVLRSKKYNPRLQNVLLLYLGTANTQRQFQMLSCKAAHQSS